MYTFLFADDQLVVAEDKEDATYMVKKLIGEFNKWGPKLNIDNTQYMAMETAGTNIQVEHGSIECIEQCT